ncbi:MAG: sulfite exporter TauE/SafE family protein [Desulfobulbaceae bacterium]|nr:sulfite exporter TauE/SafE family protein [Desulfobulbaceae bacterium]
MYFPVAGIEVRPWLPPLIAFVISFFTSMGGVSGAFLLLPFQMSFLGFVSPSVSATNHIFNIVAIPSGVYRYIKEGRMVWPLTWAVIIGTLPGVLAGAVIRVKYLPDPTTFKRFAAVVLLYIGVRLLRDILKKDQDRPPTRAPDQGQKGGIVSNAFFTVKSLGYTFEGRQYEVSTLTIMVLSLTVGIIGGVYGIGGGAIIAPFFVSFLGLPIYTVAGATLMGTMITSIAGVLFFQAMAPFVPNMAVAPDWGLGLLFGLGGFAGMYCGARMQRFVPARLIKSILTFCILFTGLRYLGLF